MKKSLMWTAGWFISLFMMSCSSRLQGFQYVNRNAGPDMTLVETEVAPPNASPEAAIQEDYTILPHSTTEKNTLTGFVHPLEELTPVTPEHLEEKDEIQMAVERVINERAQTSAVRLTEKQAQKATQLVHTWIQKKQDPSSVDWAPRTNMEMFSLGAAGVGLVVAFFSPVGWFVFLVAALAYLYLKLLKK